MANHSSLRHSMARGRRPAGGAHRVPPAGIAHTWVIRGILVLAVTLSGLGAVALAWPGHVSAGHAQVTSQQRGHSPARPAAPQLMVSKAKPKPFIY